MPDISRRDIGIPIHYSVTAAHLSIRIGPIAPHDPQDGIRRWDMISGVIAAIADTGVMVDAEHRLEWYTQEWRFECKAEDSERVLAAVLRALGPAWEATGHA